MLLVLRKIQTAYGFLIFSILFLFFLPLFFIPILFKSQFWVTGVLNRWWAKLTLGFCLLPFKVECRSKLDTRKQYIFCPNHFSYLDIPTLGLNPVNTVFVGKSAMEKIPLFGFMYRHLHITVNRSSLKSRVHSMMQSLQAIDDGKSLVIYPEGGIAAPHPPRMSPFKDGAFRVAIEKQIPVVPVTIPHNWIILPDPENVLYWGTVKVIFHEPIETKGMTLADTDELKEKVYKIIDSELKRQNHL